MSKNKKSKKTKKVINETTEISLEKAVSSSEDYSKTVEIREKRIGIVFKVIYVVAIFFASMIAVLAPSMGTGITETYLLVACASAFLLMMLYYMVAYIINEMMCLKLYADDLPKKQIELTERSYANIFKGFGLSGMISILCFIVGANFMNYISQKVIGLIFAILIFAGMSISVIQLFFKSDKKKVFVSYILWIIATCALVSLFLVPAFSTAI